MCWAVCWCFTSSVAHPSCIEEDEAQEPHPSTWEDVRFMDPLKSSTVLNLFHMMPLDHTGMLFIKKLILYKLYILANINITMSWCSTGENHSFQEWNRLNISECQSNNGWQAHESRCCLNRPHKTVRDRWPGNIRREAPASPISTLRATERWPS